MISVKTFSPEIKSMTSSFIKNMYNFDIFYQFPQFEQSKSEVWKGKILCAWGVKDRPVIEPLKKGGLLSKVWIW